MTDVVSDREYGVAFYRNRNRMILDREISFGYDFPEDRAWQPIEEVVADTDRSRYEQICKLAVSITTRIIYLPKEVNFSRALIADGVVRPTGATMFIHGGNFKGDFGMSDQDFAKDGLAFNGTHLPYFELSNCASVGSRFVVDDKYHNVDIGPSVALVDLGKSPTVIAPLDFLECWIEQVLRPIEDDIKARAYDWVGDSKTIGYLPERIV